MILPRGVWAVASGLAGDALLAWMAGVGEAAAWTFRRPPRGDAQALQDLAQMRARAPWLAVHGRRDLAQLAGADATIAGAQSIEWSALGERTRVLSPNLMLGASVHDDSEWLHAAEHLQPRFVVLGPLFETPSKREILAPQGISGLRQMVSRGCPVIAIGGI
ncbi:MAG: thiamine phosphate synthase [Planctomycetes bacterium]|nr:thiamine phosphate synthase [Planctomycetota bacterium]